MWWYELYARKVRWKNMTWIHEWENEQGMSTRMTDKYDMHDMTKEKCIWYDVWIWQ